jgi:small subunit ribosomal protein S1
MKESFAQLFEESISNVEMRPGSVVSGTILAITNDFVLIDAGLKSEAMVPVVQFKNDQGVLTIKVGDQIDVVLDAMEDNSGETRLSREKAKRFESWKKLELAHQNSEVIQGIIIGKVKGGFTVDLEGVRAFLPGSLVDVRPLRDTAFLENKPIDLKLIKLDIKRNNVVVSRRAVIEASSSAERSELLGNIQEGQTVKGVVKNLTDYGVFIDLGGIDGLLHITDMSWKRIKHPSEMVNVGDEIDVKVLKFERERSRVSLGLKQLGDDPWVSIDARFPIGKKLRGSVTNVADYGCFVELGNGIEGLVHVSEMDWTNKNINPNKIVQVGQEVEVVVLDIDEERRRISLGLKQCIENPWNKFANTHEKGDKVVGKIKSITDFGIFIGLEGDIDGLIHLSDISWDRPGEEAVRDFKKGDELEAMVLGVDVERERISLGLKQLGTDSFSNFVSQFPKGQVVKGPVVALEDGGFVIDLGGDTKGFIRGADLSREEGDSKPSVKVGSEVEAQVVGVDRKKRMINLSVKAMEENQEKQAAKDYRNKSESSISNPTLGDLLKEKMNKGSAE